MTKNIAVIGAGPSGLTTAKNLLQEQCGRVTVFDKNREVGGNWLYNEDNKHSSVYETTHIISSKRYSQYPDFPMPKHYPDYPSHRQLLSYFKDYAKHFGLYKHIRFNTEVLQVTRLDTGQWELVYRDSRGAQNEIFDALCVANGHHWDPALPQLPGHFSGPILHSHDFKKAAPYQDQRVLVIGGGNSACDVAVETSRVSTCTGISMRSGQYIVPKFMFGLPPDRLNHLSIWVPTFIRQYLFKWMLRLVQGANRNYGLQEPDCLPLESHPTLNSELFYAIRHGKVTPYPGIKACDGTKVSFVDGRVCHFDIIICATGYHISFPFFSNDLINFKGQFAVPLFRKMIPEYYDNLFIIGLFQPQGCIWPAADLQAQLAAKAINGRWRRPGDIGQKIKTEMDNPHFNWKPSPRHSVEVDYHRFCKELRQELSRAG